MNIIEAIKSEKPYKRPHWTDFYLDKSVTYPALTTEDVLANDWEIKEDVSILSIDEYTLKQLIIKFAEKLVIEDGYVPSRSYYESLANKVIDAIKLGKTSFMKHLGVKK